MRTKIFITTLLFIGFTSFAQKGGDSNSTNTQKADGSSTTPPTSNLGEAEGNYEGKTSLVNVTNDVYFLKSDTENMGVILSQEETILIDTQLEDEMNRSLKIVERLNKKASLKYLITTTNTVKNKKTTKKLKKDGTIFIAQDLSSKKNSTKKGSYSSNYIPDITYSNKIDINFNNEKIEIISLNKAGNSGVYLSRKNVLFTGPIYVYKNYPEINAEKGLSFENVSGAINVLAKKANDNTLVIPGKGQIAKKRDLVNTGKMLTNVYKQVHLLRENGSTLEQVLAMNNITRNYDTLGYGDGPITTEIFITSIYNEIAREMGPVDTRTPEERAMERLKEIQKDNKKN